MFLLIGIDRGVTNIVALSNGETVENETLDAKRNIAHSEFW